MSVGLERLGAALLAALCLAGLVAGCAAREEPEEEPQVTVEEPDTEGEGYAPADEVFSVCYTPGSTLNPFLSTDIYNDQLAGFMYEGLFALDGDLAPQPVLCESISTEDGKTYVLTLREGLRFSNGARLTARDAAYSIETAMSCDKYRNRLSCVESVEATGEIELTVKLKYADRRLPALLDTPIVPEGTAEEELPAGTGPYVMSGSRLKVNGNYRGAESVELETIYLVSREGLDLAEAFSGRVIDILGYDPTGAAPMNVHMTHETRTCSTTNLIYLGFNTASGVTSRPEVRRAIGYLVDRGTICSDIYDNAVVSAPLILSPVLEEYDAAWEEGTGYSRQSFLEAAGAAGMVDSDHDGYLETEGDFTLKLIVNSENTRRVEAARRIVTDLVNMGVRTELSVLDWEEYKEALAAGDFSMYLGEVKLRADFDLTSMLTPGGSLNYGGITDERYAELITAYLSALTEEAIDAAAEDLCLYVKEQAPVIPIAYKEYALISHVGVIDGAEPSQSGVYTGAGSWGYAFS